MRGAQTHWLPKKSRAVEASAPSAAIPPYATRDTTLESPAGAALPIAQHRQPPSSVRPPNQHPMPPDPRNCNCPTEWPSTDAEWDEHSRWLRRLAHGLVRGPASADDLVQEVWMVALRRRGAAPPTGLRAWLAGIAWRVASQVARQEGRRARREELVAQGRSKAASERLDPGQSHARIELARNLLGAVDELPGPMRDVVVQRYLEGHSAREIARERGEPLSTIRTRLRRALTRLRNALDQGGERERRDLLAALAPLAGLEPLPPWPPASPSTADATSATSTTSSWSSIASLVVSSKLPIAAALIVAGLFVWSRRPSQAPKQGGQPQTSVQAPALQQQQAIASAPENVETPARRAAALENTPSFEIRGAAWLGSNPLVACSATAELRTNENQLLHQSEAQSDAQGQLCWTLPVPGEACFLHVDAHAEGARLIDSPKLRVVPNEPLPAVELDFVALDVLLRSRVVDESRAPIAGARVILRGAQLVTDAQGRFEGRTTSRYESARVEVLAAGFARETFRRTITRPGVVEVADLVLERGALVGGRIVDESGQPVAGAEVRPWYEDRPVATSAADGSFELDSIPVGDEDDGSWIYATHADYARATLQLEAPHEVDGRLLHTGVVLVLQRGATLRGQVSLEEGSPARVTVLLASHPSSADVRRAHVTRDGSFCFEHVHAGETKLWLRAAGHAPHVTPIEVPEAGEMDLDAIELKRSQRLSGIVLDPQGQPLPRAYLYGDSNVPRRRSDGEGRFTFDDLPPGRVRIGCLAKRMLRFEKQYIGDRDDLVIRMQAAGGLAGKVVDGLTGKPVTSFTVHLDGLDGLWVGWSRGVEQKSDDGVWSTYGEYTIGARGSLQIVAPGYGPTAAEIVVAAEPDPNDVVVQLWPPTELRGTVYESAGDDRAGAPIAGVKVTLLSGSERHLEGNARETLTDGLGRFRFEATASGPTRLRLESDAHATTIDGPFEVVGGRTCERDVVLSSGVTLSGRLLDADGRAIAGGQVHLETTDSSEALPYRKWQVATNDDGHFRFAHLRAGSYQLQWVQEQGELRLSRLARRMRLTDEDLELEVRPPGRATVRGALTGGPTATVLAAVSIWPADMRARDEAHAEARTLRIFQVSTSEGQFEQRGVPAGEYTINTYWNAPDGSVWSGNATVRVPQEGLVDVQVPLQLVKSQRGAARR